MASAGPAVEAGDRQIEAQGRSLGETIDRLMSLEIRRIGFMGGVIPSLYRAARAANSDRPLAWTAATELVSRLPRHDAVVIVTGHVHPVVMPYGETDGPLGAAALARLLNLGLGVHPIIVCDASTTGVMAACLRAAGMLDGSSVPSDERTPWRSSVLEMPVDPLEGIRMADALSRQTRVGAAISIEKIGPNSAGVLHSGLGSDFSDVLARGDTLVERLGELGAYTVGIGDLGNEIGFGRIADAVREHVPYGAECRCPCKAGTANVTETDAVLVAGCSNWGAYALAAAVAAQVGKPALLHDGETELRMAYAASREGAVDGLSNGTTGEVDGMPAKLHASWVDVLKGAVEIGSDASVSPRIAFESARASASRQ